MRFVTAHAIAYPSSRRDAVECVARRVVGHAVRVTRAN
jgi:hypothetical protein